MLYHVATAAVLQVSVPASYQPVYAWWTNSTNMYIHVQSAMMHKPKSRWRCRSGRCSCWQFEHRQEISCTIQLPDCCVVLLYAAIYCLNCLLWSI